MTRLTTEASSPLGLHRVAEPAGLLPQAAWRLDTSPAIWPDEVRVRVDRLNLDAASFRQLREASGGDPDAIRTAVLEIIASRGKMHNPITGSGGMAGWDGRSEQVPCAGHAILFGRSIAAVLPGDLPVPLALAVLDVCGAPALTAEVTAPRAPEEVTPSITDTSSGQRSSILVASSAPG